MKNPFEPRTRRSQHDYSLPFKLAVVGEIGRGELGYKQAQRHYGIQGRSTVLTWCRRYASHFITFQATRPTYPGAPRRETDPEVAHQAVGNRLARVETLVGKVIERRAGPESVVTHDGASGG